MTNFDRLFDVTADELAARTRLATTFSTLPRTTDALPAVGDSEYICMRIICVQKKPATGMLIAIDVLEPDVSAFNIEVCAAKRARIIVCICSRAKPPKK